MKLLFSARAHTGARPRPRSPVTGRLFCRLALAPLSFLSLCRIFLNFTRLLRLPTLLCRARSQLLVPACVSTSVFFQFLLVSPFFACCVTSQPDTFTPANKLRKPITVSRQTPIKVSRFHLGHLGELLNSCITINSVRMHSWIINSGCNPALGLTESGTFWCSSMTIRCTIKYTQ